MVKPIESLDRKSLSLVRRARFVRKRAYAPYSKYRVGCAILDNLGKIHTGCNVENASYSGAICAERSALVKMVSRGRKEIRKLVVVTSSEEPVFPCGICLQMLSEFGGQGLVLAVNGRGTLYRESLMKDLLPQAFSKSELHKGT